MSRRCATFVIQSYFLLLFIFLLAFRDNYSLLALFVCFHGGKIIKSNPTLAIFDSDQLYKNLEKMVRSYLLFDFVLVMTCTFDDLPKIYELFILNCSIIVVIDLIEELCSLQLSEILLPMLHSFILFNSFRIIDIEDLEDFSNQS